MSADSTERPRVLRLIEYLAPSIPVELFEVIQQYLESALDRNCYLIYESRWSGPPPDRVDPFTADLADVGFMCSSYFLRLMKENNAYVELCEAAALHQHPSARNRPVYFADVVVHADSINKYKAFRDLKGSRWAFNEKLSLSGNVMVLAELKKQGFNATFFGNVIQTGSHLKSLQMVLEQTVDAAAIDSNCLQAYFSRQPDKKDKLAVITSLGPMPIYPIVFNSRLEADIKQKIQAALLDMNNQAEWAEKLGALGVSGFAHVDMSFYHMEKELMDTVKNMSITAAYY